MLRACCCPSVLCTVCLNQWHCLSHSQSQLTFALTLQPRGTLRGKRVFCIFTLIPLPVPFADYLFFPVSFFCLSAETDVPKNFTVKWATKTTVVIAWKYNQRSPFNCTVSLETGIKVAVDPVFPALKLLTSTFGFSGKLDRVQPSEDGR